jgi:hypothetical protein
LAGLIPEFYPRGGLGRSAGFSPSPTSPLNSSVHLRSAH